LDPNLAEFGAEIRRSESEIDLSRAALLIARAEYPDLDLQRYLLQLQELTDGVRSEEWAGSPLKRLHRLRRFLFEEQGFRGNDADYYDPRNSFLNDVLDRRLGIPITLSLLFMEVGRRLALPVEGIGLPGHFIVGFGTGDERILLDPFNRGAILTPESCQTVVSRAIGRPVPLEAGHFVPVTARQLLARMLSNLKAAYFKREEWEKALGILDRVLVLDPDSPGEARDRGLVFARLGKFRAAIALWERYLRREPAAPDADSIRGHLRQLRQALASLN